MDRLLALELELSQGGGDVLSGGGNLELPSRGEAQGASEGAVLTEDVGRRDASLGQILDRARQPRSPRYCVDAPDSMAASRSSAMLLFGLVRRGRDVRHRLVEVRRLDGHVPRPAAAISPTRPAVRPIWSKPRRVFSPSLETAVTSFASFFVAAARLTGAGEHARRIGDQAVDHAAGGAGTGCRKSHRSTASRVYAASMERSGSGARLLVVAADLRLLAVFGWRRRQAGRVARRGPVRPGRAGLARCGAAATEEA